MHPHMQVTLEIEDFETLCTAIESIRSLYGRARIAPYPHEHHAWQNCRKAVAVIARVRQQYHSIEKG